MKAEQRRKFIKRMRFDGALEIALLLYLDDFIREFVMKKQIFQSISLIRKTVRKYVTNTSVRSSRPSL